MVYNRSGQNLQKCNSSPMNSFIMKSNSRPQVINVSTAMFLNQQTLINTMAQVNSVGSHVNIYNSTQPPFRGGDVINHEMEHTPSSSQQHIGVDPRFVYKSNSQKSINWEGTPQNHTHKSINNKNQGSQSHQSLLGSQGKIIQTASSKKMLMPSGSSGTLLRKEIIEMDEVNSSSSSSIGREENANHAFNASNRLRKIGKLNFTGKPFAPDSIFVNSLGKNLGDDDEGGTDIIDQMQSDMIQVKGGEPKSNQQRAVKQVQKQQVIQAKNYHTASSNNQDQSQNQLNNGVIQTTQQTQQVKDQVKSVLMPKKIANVRNTSPHENIKKTSVKEQTKLLHQVPASQNLNNGRQSIPAQQVQNQDSSLVKKQILKAKEKSGGPTAKRQMANHHPQTFQVALSDLNNISSALAAKQENLTLESSQKIQLSQTQKLRISFLEQNASHNVGNSNSSGNNTTQKDESMINNSQISSKSKQQTSTQLVAQNYVKNNRSNGVANTVHMAKSNNTQFGTSVVGVNVSQLVNGPHYSSKSPAEKMIESSLLQNQYIIANASSAAQVQSRKANIDPSSVVGHQLIQTPQRHQIQTSKIRKAGNSRPQQQTNQNKSSQAPSIPKQPISERKSLQGNSKAKNSYYELEMNSPSQQNKVGSRSQFKMKGDINNFNDISLNEAEQAAIREDEEELLDSAPLFLPSNGTLIMPDKMFQRHENSNSNSPSKSNKVPSSLSFKRRSEDQSENNMESFSKRLTMVAQMSEKNKNLVDIDESSMAAVTSRGNKTTTSIFTLKDKQELNRNIPKFHNLDFSGQSSLNQAKTEIRRDTSSKSISAAHQKKRTVNGSLIITTTQILSVLVQFNDFENLMKTMSLMKKFREDFTKVPTSFQVQVFRIFKLTLRNLLILGLPSTLQRIQYWNFKTKFFYGKKKKPNLYKTLKRQKSDENEAAEIKKDVHRTFPDMKFFQLPQKGQIKLFNILNAVAQKNSSTGYIQGMNFLAGTILINLQKGEETFWMMMSILNKYKFDSILDLKNGGLFQILCFQLETFMLAYLPRLADHLKYLKIPTDIYAANWFITMFCYELSLDLVFCILDVFLLEGIKSLIRVSLALLKAMQDDLLQMSYDECMEFLSHCQKDIQLDSQTLLETAFSFKISNSLLQDLELFYRLKENPIQSKIFKVFSRLSLQEEKGKYFWIILPATPEDIKDILKVNKGLSEEDVENFYQQNIKHRKLREIVEELQTDEDSEIANVNSYAIEKKDIQNAKMLQPSQRKKETLHSKYAQNAQQSQHSKRKQLLHFNTDSNNTIMELTNDFSKGGHSNGKVNQNNSSYVTSNNSASNKLVSQETHQQHLHLSLVMKQDGEMLVTPRKMLKISNDLTQKNRKLQDSSQMNESPFIQIGSKIKSIFGNFFKTQEKLNKSYEEQQNDQMTRANFIPLSQFEKQQSPASHVGGAGTSGKGKTSKQARSKSIHHSVFQRESPEVRIATQQYNSNNGIPQKTLYIPMGFSASKDPNYQLSAAKSNIQKKAIHQQSSSISQSNPQVFQEDIHNVPSGQALFFGTSTQLQQVNKPGSLPYIESKRELLALRINKHSSKSLERGFKNDQESMVQEEDEECEVDLLSQSADYPTARVGDKSQLKKNQDFNGASKRPEILITRDYIAPPDEEVLDSHTNFSNSHTLDIQNLTINGSKMNMSGSNQLSQTIKINNSTQSSSSQALFNLKRHQGYNSNNPRGDLSREVQMNIKTMKSSPPVSPKERYAGQSGNNSMLPPNSKLTQLRGNQVFANKKR